MIVCIDDKYFNPLQITTLMQDKNDVRVWFVDTPDKSMVFTCWNINDFAAEINRLIKEF